ncbi:hypothetical protein E0Z10_g7447 [Xylaria hypoxylon]|uniref:Uncharacterized protein n=1 Tax=Xylaria hypoxylon TaxID=37992 RepID=A0A4Z0YMN6_9PEZI|nr:hypothetical protein E0Z10_g7447 [Xylaria hypoxylon]
MDSRPDPSRLLLVRSAKLQVAWNLTDLAKAVGIEPWQVEARASLADLVYGLEEAEYLPNIIMSQLLTYSWDSHDVDPTKVIEGMEPLWDSLAGDIWRMPSTFEVEKISSFSECLMWWMYYISVETGEAIPPPLFPETQAHRDAFAYVLFLLMWLRDGPAPEIVSRLYLGALAQVELDTETRRQLKPLE